MSEVEQRRERLPSERARQASGAAQRGADADGARAAKARRNAWVLGGVAVALYVGYMLWFVIRGSLG